MSKTTKKNQMFSIRPPTRQEMLIICRENRQKFERVEEELGLKADEAYKALQRFKQTNAEHRRLRNAVDRANKATDKARKKSRDNLNRLLGLIRLEGATKRVLTALQHLIERD